MEKGILDYVAHNHLHQNKVNKNIKAKNVLSDLDSNNVESEEEE